MIIPFFIPHAGCPHQCVFCNQKHITGRNQPATVSLLPQVINDYLAGAVSSAPPQVAFFGGTFTALPRETQKTWLRAVEPFIRTGKVGSVRLSTRPDCISTEILDLLKEHHVETVELGVQSMDDRVLALSGRGHSAAHTVHAVAMLREYRFSTGLQLMPGLPGDSPETFRETVAGTIELRPDFVRLYPAIVIGNTRLEQLFRTGQYTPLSLDEAVALCRDALLAFAGAGIDVIRIGLQATEELEKAGTIVAGPYHPAFRQLVESSILLDMMRDALTKARPGIATAQFAVHPADISNAIGQKRSNIETLKKDFGLKNLNIKPDSGVPRRTVRLLGLEAG